MKSEVLNHPAVLFGQWLNTKRRSCGVVSRVFAGRIELSPAEYAEVESGIVEWIKEKQEEIIPLVLNMSENEKEEFITGLSVARREPRLAFSDVYSREELSPARCCTIDGKQIDGDIKEHILDAVFKPLPRDV